jgi:hypothetical protein
MHPIREIVIVPKDDVVAEYRSMLSDVIKAQRKVRRDTDDLQEIRQMIR